MVEQFQMTTFKARHFLDFQPLLNNTHNQLRIKIIPMFAWDVGRARIVVNLIHLLNESNATKQEDEAVK